MKHRHLILRWTAVLVATAGLWWVGQTPVSAGEATGGPELRAADALALLDPAAAQALGTERLQRFRKLALGDAPGEMIAFEEHRLFTAAVTESPLPAAPDRGKPGTPPPAWIRRAILLKPSTLVIADQLYLGAPRSVSLVVRGDSAKVEGTGLRVTAPGGELVGEVLSGGSTHRSWERAADGRSVRFLPSQSSWAMYLFDLRAPGAQRLGPRGEWVARNDRSDWAITAGEHVFRLWLPPWRCLPGDIAAEKADGAALLPRRPLPAGILPHSAEGVRLLERWDSAYRGGQRPGWDTGRPSSELVKLVEDATLKPCPAIELGCGTGTNAIYLAGKGFTVTGLDIAPTALALAAEKAKEAKVNVRWGLADVLDAPRLRQAPYGLIYDRGCYHGVRGQNADAYVETLRKLSKPGTRVLILAGNANEPQHYGPPRVKEADIRRDFARGFEIERLEETRFDTTDPNRQGALAWRILLRRKE